MLLYGFVFAILSNNIASDSSLSFLAVVAWRGRAGPASSRVAGRALARGVLLACLVPLLCGRSVCACMRVCLFVLCFNSLDSPLFLPCGVRSDVSGG